MKNRVILDPATVANNVVKIFEPRSDGYTKTYKFSAWVKTPAGIDNDGGEIAIKAVQTNGSDFCSNYGSVALKTVSFSHTAGEWKYVELELSGSDVLAFTPVGFCSSGSSPATEFHLVASIFNLDSDPTHVILVDEIRFHPTDVMVESIIYNSTWKKVHSVYDHNSTPKMFMEYDDFGRNNWVLDQDKNVIRYNEFLLQDPTNPDDWNMATSYSPRIPLNKNDFLNSLQNNLFEIGDVVKFNTYMDGNGRPLQTIGCNQAPFDGTNYRDIVSFVHYDAYGRSPRSYLPYVDETDDGSFKEDVITEQLDFYSNASMVSHSNYPFSDRVFDNSPMSNVIEMGAPGENWQIGTNHTNKIEIQVNGENEVLLWKAEPNGAEAVSYYEPNKLFKRLLTDEHDLQSQIFTDVFGRTILVQKQIRAELDPGDKLITYDFTEGNSEPSEEITPITISTYYVYNELGQLIYTISPGAFEAMQGTYSFDESDPVFEDLIHASRYDAKGRVTAQKSPGSGWSYIIYDLLNRPVLSQTSNQSEQDEWNFIKYDVFGRSVMTGLFYSANSQVSLQDEVNGWPSGNWEHRNSESGSLMGYSNEAFPDINPGNDDQILTVQYFDDYNFDLQGREFKSTIHDAYKDKVFGLSTGSLVKVLDDDPDNYLLTINFYDQKYRPIQSHVQNHVNGWDVYESEYNFDNSLKKSIRFHWANSTSFPVIIKNRYEYDHVGRLVDEFMSVGSGTSPPEKLVGHYEYNLLGQLIRQDLDYKPATSDFLQHIDYRYNIRGWLTSINNAELDDDGTINFDDLDVFGEEIYYDNTDAISIDQGEESPFVPLNQYNGNISSIRWKSKNSDIPSDARPENVYCYRYDDLNQMTAAYYARTEAGVSGYYDQDYHLFNEKLSYGLDGNIWSFNRNHADGVMDELVYSYEGHKLMEVTDAITPTMGNGFTDGNTTGDDFAYDSNGNLLEDLNKELAFAYNHLNLPQLIEHGTDELRYIYDATGRKLRTIYPDSKVHDYVSGIEYNDNELLFLNTSFGRIKATGPQAYCSVNFAYEYFIKDHLGSVRAVITREENAPQHNYSATMEDAASTAEEAQFYNVAETRANGHSVLQVANGSTRASLTNSTGEPIGPAKVLYVQEGDKISIDVEYYYQTYTSGNSPRDVNDILAQLANFFITTGSVAPPGLESAWAASTFTGNSAVSSLINNAITEPDDVLAYLAYITLDENFNLIPEASGYLMADVDASVQNLTVLDLVIPQNGYIYIYVANESPTNVYFDNLQIIHEKSNVLELSDYYPIRSAK